MTFLLTFFKGLDLFVGEGRPVPLQFSLQSHPQLGILITGRIVFRIAIGSAFISFWRRQNICMNEGVEASFRVT